jgi:plasmid stabilization system protein ParE
MSSYVLGRDAEQDLNDLWDYIAADNVEAADRLMARLFDAFEALSRNPGMGHKREDLTQFPVLFWRVGNYLVIYHSTIPPLRYLRPGMCLWQKIHAAQEGLEARVGAERVEDGIDMKKRKPAAIALLVSPVKPLEDLVPPTQSQKHKSVC